VGAWVVHRHEPERAGRLRPLIMPMIGAKVVGVQASLSW
jgi:hypothetical protein